MEELIRPRRELRILTIHNKYRFGGGEDEAYESQETSLIANGHQVHKIVFDNAYIQRTNVFRVGLEATWSHKSYERTNREIKEFGPDIVDIHNFFPLASPSVHYAAFRLGVPVVQTLHNYRLLCPGAYFYRNGQVCSECTEHLIPWPSVVHRCYRGNALHTSGVALMNSVHGLLRTWQRIVTVFVAVSEFEKQRFVENGFPESRIIVKPNFVPSPGEPSPGGKDFLFVGRLSAEKGVATILKAMELVDPGVRLNVAGDGPLADEVTAAASRNPRIRYLGRLSRSQVLDRMGGANFLVFPSECYETFGMVAAEAFSRGTPVIASRIGAVAEMVEENRTGFLFRPGDARDLANVINNAFFLGGRFAEMRKEAHREYERKYTAERNYRLLLEIYARAIELKNHCSPESGGLLRSAQN